MYVFENDRKSFLMGMSVVFTSSVPPVIMGASEEFMEEMGAVVNSTVVLHCDVTGHPAPAVSWLRDGQPVHTDSQHHISEDGTQLQVSHCWLLNEYQRVNGPNCDMVYWGITLQSNLPAPQCPGVRHGWVFVCSWEQGWNSWEALQSDSAR